MDVQNGGISKESRSKKTAMQSTSVEDRIKHYNSLSSSSRYMSANMLDQSGYIIRERTVTMGSSEVTSTIIPTGSSLGSKNLRNVSSNPMIRYRTSECDDTYFPDVAILKINYPDSVVTKIVKELGGKGVTRELIRELLTAISNDPDETLMMNFIQWTLSAPVKTVESADIKMMISQEDEWFSTTLPAARTTGHCDITVDSHHVSQECETIVVEMWYTMSDNLGLTGLKEVADWTTGIQQKVAAHVLDKLVENDKKFCVFVMMKKMDGF